MASTKLTKKKLNAIGEVISEYYELKLLSVDTYYSNNGEEVRYIFTDIFNDMYRCVFSLSSFKRVYNNESVLYRCARDGWNVKDILTIQLDDNNDVLGIA